MEIESAIQYINYSPRNCTRSSLIGDVIAIAVKSENQQWLKQGVSSSKSSMLLGARMWFDFHLKQMFRHAVRRRRLTEYHRTVSRNSSLYRAVRNVSRPTSSGKGYRKLTKASSETDNNFKVIWIRDDHVLIQVKISEHVRELPTKTAYNNWSTQCHKRG